MNKSKPPSRGDMNKDLDNLMPAKARLSKSSLSTTPKPILFTKSVLESVHGVGDDEKVLRVATQIKDPLELSSKYNKCVKVQISEGVL